jgi:hypothetical protein
MTKYKDLYLQLIAPFRDGQIRYLSKGGRDMAYVTARDVAERLDEVFGFENWTDHYVPNDHSVQCTITVTLPDGKTVSKTDAGGYQGMSDQGDDDMSGYSNALKRAAVKFGIGRDLYAAGPSHKPAQRSNSYQDRAPAPQQRQQASNGDAPKQYGVPKNGRAFFAWFKKQEGEWGDGYLKQLGKWSKERGFPFRTDEWNEEQVAEAYEHASRVWFPEPAPPEDAAAY